MQNPGEEMHKADSKTGKQIKMKEAKSGWVYKNFVSQHTQFERKRETEDSHPLNRH